MNRYEIRCTEEQAKKALKLGAPIETKGIYPPIINIDNIIYFVPTAEQMIGWLEEKYDVGFHIWQGEDYYGFSLWSGDEEINYLDYFITRKEATIKAIDEALYYLIKSKEE